MLPSAKASFAASDDLDPSDRVRGPRLPGVFPRGSRWIDFLQGPAPPAAPFIGVRAMKTLTAANSSPRSWLPQLSRDINLSLSKNIIGLQRNTPHHESSLASNRFKWRSFTV